MPQLAHVGGVMRRVQNDRRLQMSTAEVAATEKAADTMEEELPTNDSSPNLLRIRHSTSHVMAMAVQKLFPGTQVTIGPWIENG